jgi:integration host factor subunit alpha
MVKQDLVDLIHKEVQIPKRKEAIEIVDALLEIMCSTLETGEEIKIAGFGKFEVKAKQPRRGRNPQTGEQITIDGRSILTFKPSNILKKKMNS